ncbi:MAG: hypothetical protein K0R08_1262 [Solimicrobium sp.]|nr:hypothetical protein [Solimicrobium sp.]
MKKFIRPFLLLISLYFGFLSVSFSTDTVSHAVQPGRGVENAISGGVGEEQRQAIRQMRKKYNLQITFAKKVTGSYVADVHVNIHNMSGEELFEADGVNPVLLVKMAPGKYRITADYEGKSQSKSVTVNRKGLKELTFYW